MDKIPYLKRQNGKYFSANFDYLKMYEEELLSFLDGNEYMGTFDFAKGVLFNEEIKFNNNIEGINDGIDLIDKVVSQDNSDGINIERKRIINLYKGYRYILDGKEINKEHLKELYDILSDGLINDNDLVLMGDYYRTHQVNILRGGHLVKPYMGVNLDNSDACNPFMGVDYNKIDDLMNLFFRYVNHSDEGCQIDSFLKSQIMHFYFVYVHPYLDVNGRTSRTVAMWYLLNNKIYPYIIFNRAIAFSEKAYSESIIKSKISGDLTLFLKYMILSVLQALEKEYLISDIKNNSSVDLTKDELHIIECFLSLKGELTVKDLALIYNNYNNIKKIKEVYFNKVLPLIDKEVFLHLGETNSYIARDIHNVRLAINGKKITGDTHKIKHLVLDKYIK